MKVDFSFLSHYTFAAGQSSSLQSRFVCILAGQSAMIGDESPENPPAGHTEDLSRVSTAVSAGSDGAQSWQQSGLILGLEADVSVHPPS